MSYNAKSVIIDIADNWGDSSRITLVSVNFWYMGSKITNILTTNFVAYDTSHFSVLYTADKVFDTSLSDDFWLSGAASNQRLICVFNTSTEFDEIRIDNGNQDGDYTDRGVQNVKINISTDEITSTVYDEEIANSTLIYDSTFDRHADSPGVDEQILTLIPPATFMFKEYRTVAHTNLRR